MLKKFCALICVFVCSAVIFAQKAPEKILSAKDVSAFVSNYASIQRDLDALGDKYDDFFDSELDDTENPTLALTQLRFLNVPAEIESVFKKNGMGDKGFEKFMVITMGVSVLYSVDTMNEQKKEYANQPEMQPYLVAIEDMMKEMLNSIHKEDLSLIKTRLKELVKLIEDED
ncbi:MAG TPA: hypothetical protein VJ861_00935 [Treponemataceae bacterium]|nr:hypothetical protein [Treponemataceae bacterium]